jgi:outer membrane autotransporter protein
MPRSERDVAAIRLLGGTANEIHNDGTILGDATPSLGTAILANGPARNTTVTNMGSIHGSIILDGTGISLTNLPGGVINAPTTLNLSGGVLQNAGTLHVGGIGTIGATTLTGDLVQSSTGRVHIDLDPALGRADLLQISGRAALDGSVVVNPISVHKGTSGPVITAAGGLTITPVLEGLAGPVFTHTAVVNGNSLSIATDADFKSNDLGKSANQRSVAGHLQRIWDSGAPGFDQGFLSLSRLSNVRAHTQALDNLSGEVHASAITAEVQTAFFVQEAILDRLRFSEGNVFSSGHGLTGTIGSRFAPGTTLPAAYSADLPGNAPPSFVPVQPVAPTYALWGQAFGAFGHTNSNGNAGHLSRQIGGFMLGAETGAGVLADWRAGVSAGYSVTNFDVTARQSTGSVESGFGAVYARGPIGPLQMRLGAAYAGNALDTRRAVLLPGFSGVASGKTAGDTVQGFGEVGYRIGLGQSYIEPFVGAAAIHVSRDSFSEVGGAVALSAFGRSYDVQTVTAGLQGQAVLSEQLGTGLPIVARGLIGYRRAFGDLEPKALLAFGGGGQGFLTAGVPIARDALVASAGLDVQIAPLVTIGVNYTGQIGDRAQDHAVKGVFSYRW